MVAKATDILPVASAREQLDLDEDDESMDTEIETAIKGAVTQAAQYTGIPLIDAKHTRDVVVMGDELPIQLMRLRDVSEVNEIKYWVPGQQAREVPNGNIDVATLGRMDEKLLAHGWVTEIWPPEGGWPNRLHELPDLRVTYTRSYAIGDSESSIVNAIILTTRHLFEQPEMEDLPMAAATLLDPYVRFNG